MKKRIGILAGFLLGIVLGVCGTCLRYQQLEDARHVFEAFQYGVESSTLLGTGVEWQEYPQFRTVELRLDGELVVNLPKEARIKPEGIVDEAALKEVSRETMRLNDGKEIRLYDKVTYLFENVEIKANLANVYGELEDATYGYELAWKYGTKVYGWSWRRPWQTRELEHIWNPESLRSAYGQKACVGAFLIRHPESTGLWCMEPMMIGEHVRYLKAL